MVWASLGALLAGSLFLAWFLRRQVWARVRKMNWSQQVRSLVAFAGLVLLLGMALLLFNATACTYPDKSGSGRPRPPVPYTATARSQMWMERMSIHSLPHTLAARPSSVSHGTAGHVLETWPRLNSGTVPGRNETPHPPVLPRTAADPSRKDATRPPSDSPTYPPSRVSTQPWNGRVRATVAVDGPSKLSCHDTTQCPASTWCDYGTCVEKCWDTTRRSGEWILRDRNGWCRYTMQETKELFGPQELERWKYAKRASLTVRGPKRLRCSDTKHCPAGTWCEFGKCTEQCHDTAFRNGFMVNRDEDGWCQYVMPELLDLFGIQEIRAHGTHWGGLAVMEEDAPLRSLLLTTNRLAAPEFAFEDTDRPKKWRFGEPALDQFGNFRLGTYMTDTDWVPCVDAERCWKRRCEPGSTAWEADWVQCPDGTICNQRADDDCLCDRSEARPLSAADQSTYPKAQCVCETTGNQANKPQKFDHNGLCLCIDDGACKWVGEGKCYERNSLTGVGTEEGSMPGVCAFGRFARTDFDYPARVAPTNGPNVERKGTSYRLDFEQIIKPMRWSTAIELKRGHKAIAVTAVLTVNDKLSASHLTLQLKNVASKPGRLAEIWICIFAISKADHFVDVVDVFKRKNPTVPVHLIRSGYDFKYFGRFQLAMQASTQYVAFFDDDQIPGPTTLELMIEATEEYKKKDSRPAIFGIAPKCQVKSEVISRIGCPALKRGHWFVPRVLLHAMFSVPFEEIDLYTLSSAARHMYGAQTFELCPRDPSDEVQEVRTDGRSKEVRRLEPRVHSHLQALQQLAQCSGDDARTCVMTQKPEFTTHPLQSYTAALHLAAQLPCEMSGAKSGEELLVLEQRTADARLKMALQIGAQLPAEPAGCDQQPKISPHVPPKQDNRDASVTVVFNVYKRVSLLIKQLKSLTMSSLKPDEIWVCIFGSPKANEFKRQIESFNAKRIFKSLHVISSSYNFKYFGRFQLAMQARTKYVAFFDDDQIPGLTTLALLVAVAEKMKQPAILGLTGRVFNRPTPTHGMEWYHMSNVLYGTDWFENSCRRSTGPRAPCHAAVLLDNEREIKMCLVDGLNRHWLVPTDVIRSLFVRDLFTFATMEDYMLSFRARKYSGIQTYTVCPRGVSDQVRLDEGSVMGTTQNDHINGMEMNVFRGNLIKRTYWSGLAPAVVDYDSCEQRDGAGNNVAEQCSDTLAVTWWKPDIKKCGNRPDVNITLTAWTCLVVDEDALSECLSSPQNLRCVLVSNVGDRSLSLSHAIVGIFEILCTINHGSGVKMELQPDLQAPEFSVEAQSVELAYKAYHDLGCNRSIFTRQIH